MKASRGWDGKIIEMQTKEQDKNGNEYTIYAKFRKYDTWTDSINDRAELLKKSSTYDVDGITNADEFAKRLEKWATDIDYSETLIKHMKKYDLYKFDTMTVEEFKEDSNNIMVSGDSELGNAIANSALSKRGCHYVWGASGPDTFDCSGLVWWACNENGVKFERTTASQLSKMGKSVKYEELQAGDIITKMNGERIYLQDEVTLFSALNRGETIKIEYKRDGKRNTTTVVPKFSDEDNRYYIGFTIGEHLECKGLSLIKYSAYEVRYWLNATVKPVDAFSGEIVDE